MKKIYSILMLAALLVAVPSCKDKYVPDVPDQEQQGGDEKPGDEQPGEGEEGEDPAPAGADTIVFTSLNAMEVDFYPSSSEEGAYNYTIYLFNEKDENLLPIVGFDIFAKAEGAYAGEYSVKAGNLSLEYAYVDYVNNGDSISEYLEDASVKIEANGDKLHVYGSAVAEGAQTVFCFDVTAEYYYMNAEFPYEPMEATSLMVDIEDAELDPSYVEYGVVDIFGMSERFDLNLEYLTDALAENGGIADGEYVLDMSGEMGTFTFGGDMWGFTVGSYVVDYEGDPEYGTVYYLVSGKVTISGNGTHCAFDAKSYYGSTIKGEFDFEIGEGEEWGDLDFEFAPAKRSNHISKHMVSRQERKFKRK